MNPNQFIDFCQKYIQACSLEIEDVLPEEDGLVLLTGRGFNSEPKLFAIYLSQEPSENIESIASKLQEKRKLFGCDNIVLTLQYFLPKPQKEELREKLNVVVWDLAKFGAHIFLANESFDKTHQTIFSGHYKMIDGYDVVAASLFLNYLMEGGFAEIRGDAYYGINNEYGPNMGGLEFVADDFEDTIQIHRDWEEKSYSAAKRGNKIVFETYEYVFDEIVPYRAVFEFNGETLLCTEENHHHSGYGHNVGFQGNYLLGTFAHEDKNSVSDQQIEDIAYGFSGNFRSNRIGNAEIRNWLNQFETENQPLMAQLLRSVKFYNLIDVRQAMLYLHRKVVDYIQELSPGTLEFLVSAFGNPAKSGSSYARIFRQENELPINNVTNVSDIPQVLTSNPQIKAIVFVEDVIGTGQDAINMLNELDQLCGQILKERQIAVIVSAICALEHGAQAVRECKFDFPVKVFCMDEVSKCFDSELNLFSSVEEKARAKEIALGIGKRLRPDKPLGYEDCQMLVAFHDNCPNNTLPFLWASPLPGTSLKWKPLFPRI